MRERGERERGIIVLVARVNRDLEYKGREKRKGEIMM